MNDSTTSRSEKNHAASDSHRQIAESQPLAKLENREIILESQTENISLPPDKLNDLFLQAESTARQKASTELERLKIENQKLQIENQGLELQNLRLKDESVRLTELHDTRKQYVGRLFWLITAWLAVVVVLVALTATLKNIFTLADSVLIAFITSTTVSVIALFVIVAKWLFPAAKDDKKEN
jgi:hypothetical protein